MRCPHFRGSFVRFSIYMYVAGTMHNVWIKKQRCLHLGVILHMLIRQYMTCIMVLVTVSHLWLS